MVACLLAECSDTGIKNRLCVINQTSVNHLIEYISHYWSCRVYLMSDLSIILPRRLGLDNISNVGGTQPFLNYMDQISNVTQTLRW